MPCYKYCIVPNCVNNTTLAPNKLYFRVPKDAKTSAEWCKIMKRNDRTPLSHKTAKHCCEDHFDLKKDMKDYTKYKMSGSHIVRKLKNDVVPHKFDCQKKQNDIILVKMSANQNQKQIQLFEKVLNTKIKPENIIEVPIEFIKSEPTDTDPIEGTNIV